MPCTVLNGYSAVDWCLLCVRKVGQGVFNRGLQVTEWVRMLIDAHLPRLLMTKTPSASLVKILELTKKQVRDCGMSM